MKEKVETLSAREASLIHDYIVDRISEQWNYLVHFMHVHCVENNISKEDKDAVVENYIQGIRALIDSIPVGYGYQDEKSIYRKATQKFMHNYILRRIK